MTLRESVEAGLAALGPLDVRDQAAADLALQYADALDLCRDATKGEVAVESADASILATKSLGSMGPKLLAALVQLRMTPYSRAANVRHTDEDVITPLPAADEPVAEEENPLERLRRQRAGRR